LAVFFYFADAKNVVEVACGYLEFTERQFQNNNDIIY